MARNRFLIPLRWSDMDAYGHVNNVQYLRLLEQARVLAFHSTNGGAGPSLLETGMVVARQEIEYLTPLHYRPEPVAVDLWVSKVSGASFDLGYEVLDPETAGSPTVYARAESTMVAFDLAAGRPSRICDQHRALFENEWFDEPVALRRRTRDAR